jgi:hypothetical protein
MILAVLPLSRPSSREARYARRRLFPAGRAATVKVSIKRRPSWGAASPSVYCPVSRAGFRTSPIRHGGLKIYRLKVGLLTEKLARSFAGLFGAAPSAALATLGIAVFTHAWPAIERRPLANLIRVLSA